MHRNRFGLRLAALVVSLAITVPSIAQQAANTPAPVTAPAIAPSESAAASLPQPHLVFAAFREEALKQVRADADAGSPGAAFALATSLLADPVSATARAEGAKYMEQAAESGIIAAQVQYAGLLRSGLHGVPVDRERALDMLEDAASTGDGEAIAALGLFVLDTQIGAEGHARGLALIEEAVELGDVGASNLLGSLYQRGRAVAMDGQNALYYFRRGVVAGSVSSIIAAADLLRFGGPNVPADPAQAMALYREAAGRGNFGAGRRVADMILRGETVPASLEEAERQLTALATAGDTSAYVALAEIYIRNEFTIVDGAKARDYLQKSADAGNTSGLRRIGDLYRTGVRGLEQDLNKAIEVYTEAASQGDVASLRELGNMYLDLTLPFADPLLGIDYLDKAAAGGDANAAIQLGNLYSVNALVAADYDIASRYFERAANLGDIEAPVSKAVAIANGPLAIAHGEEALDLLTRSVASGTPGASTELARLQLAGRFQGRGPDGVISMLLESTRAGDASAARFLMELYRDGLGFVLEPDREAAVNLLGSLEDVLGTEGVTVERILLNARDAATTDAMSEIADQFHTLTRANGISVLRQLRRINARAYVYVAQRELAARGIYTGAITGTLDSRTISALRVACEQMQAAAQCAAGPLTDGAVVVIGSLLFEPVVATTES